MNDPARCEHVRTAQIFLSTFVAGKSKVLAHLMKSVSTLQKTSLWNWVKA